MGFRLWHTSELGKLNCWEIQLSKDFLNFFLFIYLFFFFLWLTPKLFLPKGSVFHLSYTSTKCGLVIFSLATNYKAEIYALKEAVNIVSNGNGGTHPQKFVCFFLTYCKSAIQWLQQPKENVERETHDLLCELAKHSQVNIQWIPVHCCLSGNEEADRLAKNGSKQEQQSQPISFKEARKLIKNKFQKKFQESHRIKEDEIKHLSRHEQTTIFHLRTGHCRLRAHLYRIGICHSPDCICQTGPQTPEHILQSCPLFTEERHKHWSDEKTLVQKLYGKQEELKTTTSFISSTKLDVWDCSREKRRKRKN